MAIVGLVRLSVESSCVCFRLKKLTNPDFLLVLVVDFLSLGNSSCCFSPSTLNSPESLSLVSTSNLSCSYNKV